MTIQFPLFPDDAIFPLPDSRSLVNNRQILTRMPNSAEEEPLTRSVSVSGSGGFANLPSTSRGLPQNQRQRYASVKRTLGDSRPLDIDREDGTSAYSVNTYEKTYKKSVTEESKERAKRALLDKPRRPKAYVNPLERKREQQGFQREPEKPRISAERMEEFRKRQSVHIGDRVSFEDTMEIEPLPFGKTVPKQQGNIFNREESDYFQNKSEFRQKRENLFNRGV
ncbi:MAG: hypothetical protein LBI11_03255 [Streptococcaceae bacterium]|jgi:hypothetical protein|nr:hypothetical protein [Streptococcaceae bacterium]